MRGTRTVVRVPMPAIDSISMRPPSAAILRFTTSIPTPRPDTSVTTSAVENRLEDQHPDLRIAHRIGHRHAALPRLGNDSLAIQASAVVTHLDDHVAGLLEGLRGDGADRTLSQRLALLR